MAALGVAEADLSEAYIKGGGKGGQKINKSATCVVLKHIETGIVVKCQKDRSRELNRFFARRLLCDQLEQKRDPKHSQAQSKIDKIRKQKARRKRRSDHASS